jgi:hypothetical protein
MKIYGTGARARTRARARERPDGACNTADVGERRTCAAVTRDGARCRSAAVSGEAFCAHHLSLVAEHGEESLRRGDYVSQRRRDSALVRVVAEQGNGNGSQPAQVSKRTGSVSASEVRPLLGELVGAHADQLGQTLLDVALNASKTSWASARVQVLPARRSL